MEPIKTLADLAAAYQAHRESLRLSPFLLRVTRYHLQNFADWLENTYQIRTADRLQSQHLENWQKHWASRRTRRGLPLKPKSLNKQVESLRGFLKYLAGHGLILQALVDKLQYVKEPRLLPSSVLDHAQVKIVLKAVDTTHAEGCRDRAILELLYSSGVRARELVGLNVQDVHLDNATALVMGKGQKQRVVPIGKTALRQLESYIKAVRPFLVRDPGETALFVNHRGERLLYHTLLRLVHRQTAGQGLEVNVTPHTFRRSCTTELIRGGANLYHVKELLGHETLETLRHYTRLTIEDLKKTHAKCHPRERGEQT